MLVAAIPRVMGSLWNIRIELTNHLWKSNDCPICNIFVQDLILCLHHYVLSSLPLLSMGIQVFLRKLILMYSPPPESVQSGDTPSSRQWDLVGVADSNQLGTPERIQELEKMKEKRTEYGMATTC